MPVEMPKLGNTVEECLLAAWRKQKGDAVAEGVDGAGWRDPAGDVLRGG
jgi:hypothetical protein